MISQVVELPLRQMFGVITHVLSLMTVWNSPLYCPVLLSGVQFL